MSMHPEFYPTRSTAEWHAFFALWSEYSLSRKRRSDVFRLVVNSLDKDLYEAVTTRSPSASAHVLVPMLFFRADCAALSAFESRLSTHQF